jgi:hypothetical protein
VDRRKYPRGTEYIQEGSSPLVPSPIQTLTHQMWVSAEEYKEDPDIIHKKAF